MKKLSFIALLAALVMLSGCAGGLKPRDRSQTIGQEKQSIAERSSKTKAAMSSYTTKAAPVGADTLLISDSEASNATKKASISAMKTAIGLGTGADAVFGSVNAAGGTLSAGVANTTQGTLVLYTNTNPVYAFGLSPAASPSATVSLKAPAAMPSADNSLFNCDINGTCGWTDPATLGGGAVAIDDLTDVDTTGKATGKILKFDASGNLVVGDDSTGSGSVPDGTVNGQLLIWATDQWVASTVPTWNQNTTGSAATLTTARTIGGVSFNGSANINLPGVNTTGNQNTSGTAAGITGYTLDGDAIGEVVVVHDDGGGNPALPFTLDLMDLTSGATAISPPGTSGYALTVDTSGVITWANKQAADADLDDLADGTLTGSKVSASSDTAVGVIEIATTAETTAGTSASLAVTPDGLSGSVYGQKEIGWSVINSDTVTEVADGKQAAVVPASMNGMNLVDLTCSVHDLNSAASGTTTVVLRRIRGATAADMTSTGVTIDYNAYTASDETIDTANDDLATGDKLYIDVNAVTTAVQKGLSCTALFQTP